MALGRLATLAVKTNTSRVHAPPDAPDGAGISSLPTMDLLYRYGEVHVASLDLFSFSLEVHGSS